MPGPVSWIETRHVTTPPPALSSEVVRWSVGAGVPWVEVISFEETLIVPPCALLVGSASVAGASTDNLQALDARLPGGEELSQRAAGTHP